MVFGDDGPAIAHFFDLAFASVDHRLDGEDHAGHKLHQSTGLAVVQNLGFFVKATTYAMATKFAHHREAVAFGKFLDGVTNVTQVGAGFNLLNAFPHGLVGQLGQALGCNGCLADHEHSAGVAMPTFLDGGDVNIQRIAFFEWLVVRDTVADLVVDRGADRLGVRLVASRRIVQRGGDALLYIHHVVMAQFVDFVCCDSGLDKGLDKVQNFSGQAASDTHALNIFGGFDGDCHGQDYPTGHLPRGMPGFPQLKSFFPDSPIQRPRRCFSCLFTRPPRVPSHHDFRGR